MPNQDPLSQEPLISVGCPNCGHPMVLLSSYEIPTGGERAMPGPQGIGPFISAWWTSIFLCLLDLVTRNERPMRLARRKAEILPRSPEALVCPACLEIQE